MVAKYNRLSHEKVASDVGLDFKRLPMVLSAATALKGAVRLNPNTNAARRLNRRR